LPQEAPDSGHNYLNFQLNIIQEGKRQINLIPELEREEVLNTSTLTWIFSLILAFTVSS
jgi:hypothetical protein